MNNENTFSRHEEKDWFIKTRNTIYYILGVLEVVLAFRLLFKLLGASTSSGFVVFIYTITRPFVIPFRGIFGMISSRGDSIQSVLEFDTVIAMVVYAVIARGIVSLVKLKAPGNA